jgi:hypothetical protein
MLMSEAIPCSMSATFYFTFLDTVIWGDLYPEVTIKGNPHSGDVAHQALSRNPHSSHSRQSLGNQNLIA